MKKIITMSGDIGSGKSSVASYLKEMITFDVIGTGVIQRDIAKRRGLTTLELNKISETDRSIDDEIDSYVIELGKTRDNLIIDSRLAWHFIPSAFKVFLAVDNIIGAERVFNAARHDEHNPSLEITLANNLKRQVFEDQRFAKLYFINFRKYSHYDLVIDTSYTSPEIIARKIKDCFELWLQYIPQATLWLNPKRLIPTRIPNEATDNSQQYPVIEVMVLNGLIYIWNGHTTTLQAYRTGVELIPAKILTEEANGLLGGGQTAKSVTDAVSLSLLHEWENALGFQYKTYPQALIAREADK